jgi:hypothetical protein
VYDLGVSRNRAKGSEMAPKRGDVVGAGKNRTSRVVNIEDYGADTAMRYTLEDGQVLYACHWDFRQNADGTFHYLRQEHSNWGS